MFSGKRILLGVTGGIAAYKAVMLLREFQKAGAEVRVTMTPSATRFVGIETFASLSRSEVAVQVFSSDTSSPGSPDGWTRHIQWGEWADLFVIAPCTANTLAKIAGGLADNMLTSTVAAARCPIVLCPTMDGEMYRAPATRQNLSKVREFGYHILEPEEGYLASGQTGTGRLPEIETILEQCRNLLSSKKKDKGPLTGKTVLVTAGPTREHIDPVRFISNPSSGKMGFAMARAARRLGGDVVLIHGPVQIEPPAGIKSFAIESAEELFNMVKEYSTADVIIMSAAVSDFAPAEYHEQKVKKKGAKTELQLKKTTDILSWLGRHKKNGQVLIGFAMETEKLIENALMKLEEKNADWLVANSLSEPGSGFQSDTNSVYLLGRKSRKQFNGTKEHVALDLLSDIFSDTT